MLMEDEGYRPSVGGITVERASLVLGNPRFQPALRRADIVRTRRRSAGCKRRRSCRIACNGALDQRIEVGGYGVNRLLELGECPPAEGAEVVDARHPIGV